MEQQTVQRMDITAEILPEAGPHTDLQWKCENEKCGHAEAFPLSLPADSKTGGMVEDSGTKTKL